MATTKKSTAVEEATIEKSAEEIVAEATAEKKAPAKKTTRKTTTKKAKEVKCEIAVQFAGKSYTQEALLKIAKDVWVYDLQRKEEDLLTVEIYVKPEENSAYYVFNGTETGCFFI